MSVDPQFATTATAALSAPSFSQNAIPSGA